jgi:uncharacterized protein (UPF0261 family)
MILDHWHQNNFIYHYTQLKLGAQPLYVKTPCVTTIRLSTAASYAIISRHAPSAGGTAQTKEEQLNGPPTADVAE